jgi:hypothetical protein
MIGRESTAIDPETTVTAMIGTDTQTTENESIMITVTTWIENAATNKETSKIATTMTDRATIKDK